MFGLINKEFPAYILFRLRILFSNSLGLRSYLNVRDHASQPYRTGNIIVLRVHILIFKFLERNREDKSVWTE